jgi:Amiloride-sensitive sodium channel
VRKFIRKVEFFIAKLSLNLKDLVNFKILNNFLLFVSLIWLAIMLVGVLLALSITIKAWQRFRLNPTFTSLILHQNQMKMVYPTVSVCPDSSEDENEISRLIEKLGITSNETEELREFFKAIPNFNYGVKGLRSVVLSDGAKKIVDQLTSIDVRALAFKLAKSCDNVFSQQCKFKNDIISCCDAFLPIYTEHGFCYAFNSKVYGTEKKE